MNSTFWRGRRVLVTGHTGFKGSWLSIWLHAMGARVTGISLDPPSQPNLFEVAGVSRLLTDRRVDIRDFGALARAVSLSDPEIVFHLAAQAIVRDGYRDPLGTFSTNVLGTAHLLETIRQCGQVRAAVVVTSDKCYENDESGRAFSEGDRLGGHDPYSSSKACAELVTSSYRRSFLGDSRVGVATVRAGNVIGGGDWARDRLLPDLVRGFVTPPHARIRSPGAVRPWQHVLEPLAGCLTIAERLAAGRRDLATAWNLGPNDVDVGTVSYVAARAAAAWGDGANWEIETEPQPHEAGRLQLDSSRAREMLGWKSRWTVDRAVDETVRWYVAHARGSDVLALCREQIASYTEESDGAA